MLTASQISVFIPDLLSLAAKSPCSRDKRGAMVVRDDTILGRGWNSPSSGACSDTVCNKETTTGNFHVYSVPEGCSRYVLHAEVKAMHRAVCEQARRIARIAIDQFKVLAYRGTVVDERVWLRSLFETDRPLDGCDIVHLNTARCHDWHHGHGNDNAEKLPACQYCRGTERVAKPSSRGKACPTCAVQALDFGVSGIWLFHDKLEGDGTEWVRYTTGAYGREAGVL